MTVTELAREAGVTERTFFRHFPTKEAVLFQGYETQLLAAALVAAVEHWGRNGCVGDFGAIVAASLNLIRSGLAPLADSIGQAHQW